MIAVTVGYVSRRSAVRPDLARRLVAAGWLFAVGSGIHLIDHLRRGQGSVSEALYWVGNLGLILQIVTITLIMTRHRSAPIAGVAAGFPLALGFSAAHWLPEWSSLSDPLWEIESWTWYSWIASSTEIAGALAVGIVGLQLVRARGIESFGPTPTVGA